MQTTDISRSSVRKPTKRTCSPSEDSDQPGNLPSLTRVFTMRLMGSSGPNTSSGGQGRRMPRLICLQWAHKSSYMLVLSCCGWFTGGASNRVWQWWYQLVSVICRLHNFCLLKMTETYIGPRQANLVLIAYASSEGSGEPAHSRSLARTFAARSYKQWVKRNLQTVNQISGPSEWLGMRS